MWINRIPLAFLLLPVMEENLCGYVAQVFYGPDAIPVTQLTQLAT